MLRTARAQRDDLCLDPFGKSAHMLTPQFECLSLLCCVERSIVDAGHPGLVAGDVVENGLDHMGLDPKLR